LSYRKAKDDPMRAKPLPPSTRLTAVALALLTFGPGAVSANSLGPPRGPELAAPVRGEPPREGQQGKQQEDQKDAQHDVWAAMTPAPGGQVRIHVDGPTGTQVVRLADGAPLGQLPVTFVLPRSATPVRLSLRRAGERARTLTLVPDVKVELRR
jgi:hypothetical protein